MQLSHLTPGQEATVTAFDDSLEYCKVQLASGGSVELPGNVEQRFGCEMAANYFAHLLGLEIGHKVTVYTGGDGLHTIVRFVLEQELRGPDFSMSAEPSSFTSTSTEQPTTATNTASSIRKGPPRPMNCWMLYRDTRHKQLNYQYPHLTVQQISTLCSEDWKNLPAAQKDEWRARAKDAKEEHQRMYPDYKYSPRKPGQKKKRQSRKAARAAMTATAPAHITPSGEIHSASQSDISPVSVGFDVDTFAASENILDNINDTLFGGSVQMSEVDDAPSQQGPLFHDNETARHNMLEVELDPDFDFDPYDFLGDEGYAFRDGADASITLPCFTSEMF
ncbi:uncharacterized protein N0V89_003113 [Didymosphaeria variabile]|uniref:HMG box domain-containing protein n=1 Tax=Didymosphaeria variabile TaxID=1932322 RepID=A0A9W8XTY8_9PLEO|nr:uncharacterized protein N0V89_003113 [Didymosphaeria variabile]KAJ4358529.1 hypothetical protein N0V89_003113 [Didymosphaeria variabile]